MSPRRALVAALIAPALLIGCGDGDGGPLGDGGGGSDGDSTAVESRQEATRVVVETSSDGFNPAGREIDDATVADALVCVESRAADLADFPTGSNDLLMPIRDGVISADHVYAEIGDLVAGTRPGRTSRNQITLYKSVGVAVQDGAQLSPRTDVVLRP